MKSGRDRAPVQTKRWGRPPRMPATNRPAVNFEMPSASERPLLLTRRCTRVRMPLCLLLVGCLAVLLQCRSVPLTDPFAIDLDDALEHLAVIQPKQNCAKEYAGELLAYFMKVVLGQAGRPDQRRNWRARAIDHPLDLATITRELDDAGQDKSRLMVLDTSLLGFSDVLYHYDPMLNQFKGRYAYHSVYPSPELIALRILLLKKLYRGEKIDLTALLVRQDLLVGPVRSPSAAELKTINLRPEEFRLLRDVLNADPQLLRYLYNPFLVKALADVGVIRRDRYVSRMSRQANYRKVADNDQSTQNGGAAVTIAILPSVTKEFVTCDHPAATGGRPFAPTETYHRVTQDLRRAIVQSALERTARSSGALMQDTQWWNDFVSREIGFVIVESRPLLVTPQNVEQVMSDICPAADAVLVLLGEDVYRTVDIDPERDVYPSVNRWYLDIRDVRYGDVQSELGQVGDVVYRKLMARLPDPNRDPHALTATAINPPPDPGKTERMLRPAEKAHN